MLFCCLLLSFAEIPCAAETADNEFAEALPEEFTPWLDALPPELRELLPPELFSQNSGDVGEAVREMSSFSYLLQAVLSTLGVKLGDAVRLLATLVGLLLLSAVFSALRKSIRSESLGSAFGLCSSLAVFAALSAQGFSCIQSVTDYFEKLTALTSSSLPLLGVLYAMGGNLTTAAASAAGLSAYLALLEGFVAKSILPFCGICLFFSLIISLDSGVRLGTLLSSFKKQYTTALAFLMMLLLAMLGAQTTLGARQDSLAMRSAKFAAGNLIPVVGGSVSELLRTVSAGVGYLRGTVGICGVLLLLFLLLPTLIELLLFRAVWQLAASAADLLGCDGERRLLDEIASLCGYLIAGVSICSSVLLLAMTLLAHCASAIG